MRQRSAQGFLAVVAESLVRFFDHEFAKCTSPHSPPLMLLLLLLLVAVALFARRGWMGSRQNVCTRSSSSSLLGWTGREGRRSGDICIWCCWSLSFLRLRLLFPATTGQLVLKWGGGLKTGGSSSDFPERERANASCGGCCNLSPGRRGQKNRREEAKKKSCQSCKTTTSSSSFSTPLSARFLHSSCSLALCLSL